MPTSLLRRTRALARLTVIFELAAVVLLSAALAAASASARLSTG